MNLNSTYIEFNEFEVSCEQEYNNSRNQKSVIIINGLLKLHKRRKIMKKERLYELIDQRCKEFEKISDTVWDTPELCFKEFESTKVQREFMENEGFKITTPVAEMDTAFIAEFGTGKPVIAILGENDALAAQSQMADVAEAKPIVEGANGHACGHNLLGTGSMEAACALKTYMTENNISGTIRYYACPAEEGGGGKVFLARSGAFDDVDVAFSWHPSDDNTLDNTGLACVTFDLNFKGKAAHAAGEPWNGRSALDAAELMNVGVQFLREHVTTDTRIHYAFLNSGGIAPNVVHSATTLRYCVRAASSDYMEEVYKRVMKIAEGAAMMTETTVEGPFISSAYNDFLWNDTLDDLVLSNLEKLLPIKYTKEEEEYAAKFQKHGNKPDAEYPLDMTINYDRRKPARGSTDVADVSYCVPISQSRVVSAAIGSIGHGWTTTAQGKSSIAHKGMHTAAKMIAGCVYDIWNDPELIEKAKADHMKMTNGRKYHTMMPASMKPGE